MPKKPKSSNLKTSLKNSLNGASRIAVLGIGSELRGDDIAGILAAQELESSTKQIEKKIPFKVFLGYTAPENLSGEIRKFLPSHLIMIDTADMGEKPGEIRAFSPQDAGGMSFSTHKLPIKVMAEYLTRSIGCVVVVIGIQPKILDFGSPATKTVQKAANKAADVIKELLF